MKNLRRRLKQKSRSHDDNAEPANQSPASEPTALTTQVTNAPVQLPDSHIDQSGNFGNALVESTPTAPPTQELSTVSLEEAYSDQATSTSLSEWRDISHPSIG
ncbi:hypothetical protein FVEN_g3679 [Fusarium venenatum]|nr:hypothetical protein FVEN_g3679 [Fusarium venenatum]